MKFALELPRAKAFLGNAVAYNGAKARCASTVAKFTPQGVSIRSTLEGDLLMLADYKTEYFLDTDGFQAGDPEFFTITKAQIEELKKGFKGDKIHFSTDDKKLYIRGEEGKDDQVDIDLVAPATDQYLTNKVEDTEIGLMFHVKARPDDKSACTTDPSVQTVPEYFDAQFLIPSNVFKDLPDASEVAIVYDKDGLHIIAKDELIRRNRPITISKIVGQPKTVSCVVIREMLEAVAAQFEGEIYLNMNSKRVALTQKNKNFSLTYAMIAKQQGA